MHVGKQLETNFKIPPLCQSCINQHTATAMLGMISSVSVSCSDLCISVEFSSLHYDRLPASVFISISRG